MSKRVRRWVRASTALGVMVGMLAISGVAFAGTFAVNYTGQGFTADESGGYIVNDERCGLGVQSPANDGGTGQFANWDGPGDPYDTGDPYIVWVLTANGATSATLTLPDGTVSMFKVGGTFKYASKWYNPPTLFPGSSPTTPVFANYVRSSRSNAQLTVSHGCAPHTSDGAWCSPGYWKNTLKNFNPNGWTTIGVDPTTAMFNGNVSTLYYANDLSPDQLLTYVLNNPGDFGGQLGTAGPYGLTAFNAVGAYLTDQIDGFSFDPSLIPSEGDPDIDEACPIDAHGNFKE